jgi:DNA-binding transcriptional LysR family regulator
MTSWRSRPNLGERWPSRLVATAAEDRLSVRRNSHTLFSVATQRLPNHRDYDSTSAVTFGYRRRKSRVVNLIEEGMDVAVRIAHLRDSSVVAIPVGRVRRVVCASENYLRRHGTPLTPNDIRVHRCVRHLGLVPRSEWHLRNGNRQLTVPISSTITCNEIESAIDACISGLGLGMFLSYMVAPHRKSGQLKYVLEKFETEPTPVQIVYPQARLMSNKVRVFVDECVRKLRQTKFD